MKLYNLTLDAINQIDTYRHPNIDEWVSQIDPVLEALGECRIKNDQVVSIYLDKQKLYITTHYSVRCCMQSNDMSIPIELLKSDEPIKLASRIKAKNDFEEAKHKVEQLLKELSWAQEKLTKTEEIYQGTLK